MDAVPDLFIGRTWKICSSDGGCKESVAAKQRIVYIDAHASTGMTRRMQKSEIHVPDLQVVAVSDQQVCLM